MITHPQGGKLSKFTESLLQLGYQKKDLPFVSLLFSDFPSFKFTLGRKFAFRPPRTIIIGPREPSWQLLLLHEIGHALSNHRSFNTHIDRLKMETEAWDKAQELSKTYHIPWDDFVANAELDTYRDWLHQKSRCPSCGLTRFQTPDGQYHCPRCESFKRLSLPGHDVKSDHP